MPKFAYEALDTDGRVIQGVAEAVNAEAVIEDLRIARFTVYHIKEQTGIIAWLRAWRSRWRRVTLWSLVVFTRQFATLFNSGVPLLRGLGGLTQQSLNKRLCMTLEQVMLDIESGMSIARAMARHPDVFSPVYVAMVKAGEVSGALGETLERLAVYLERDLQLQRRVRTATRYPLLVFCFAIALTTFLVLWVFPTFVTLLDGLNIRLPWTTRFLILVTDFAYSPIFLIAFPCIALACVMVYARWTSRSSGRRWRDHLLLTIPYVGSINRRVIVSRFCRTLSTLISSGVPVMQAIDIVSKVTSNVIFADILDEVKQGIRAGLTLSQPLRGFTLFPPVVSQMIGVGEETGRVPEVLQKLASFYDGEIEASLNVFSSLIEPVMICFMGGVVGFILLSVFMPVYEILQNFSP